MPCTQAAREERRRKFEAEQKRAIEVSIPFELRSAIDALHALGRVVSSREPGERCDPALLDDIAALSSELRATAGQ
jgi:hypothetical protein